jgi:hypothetical protein
MSARDILFIVVFLFALGIGFFSLNFVFNQAIDKMVSVPSINSSVATTSALESARTNGVNRLDYVVFGCFIGLCIALLITSFFIGGNPIFMIIYFFIVVIGVVLSIVFSNTWETYIAMTIFGSTSSYFPITNNIMANLPIYSAIIGFLGIVTMFAKPFLFPEQ